LMEMNDIVAPDLEKKFGVTTFRNTEMALLLTGLVCLSQRAEIDSVVVADLSGGLGKVADLSGALASIRSSLLSRAKRARETHELKQLFGIAAGAGDSRKISPLG